MYTKKVPNKSAMIFCEFIYESFKIVKTIVCLFTTNFEKFCLFSKFFQKQFCSHFFQKKFVVNIQIISSEVKPKSEHVLFFWSNKVHL